MPGFDQLQISLEGQAQGWLQATCTYYGLGWLEPEQATGALKRLVLLIGKDLGSSSGCGSQNGGAEARPGLSIGVARFPSRMSLSWHRTDFPCVRGKIS